MSNSNLGLNRKISNVLSKNLNDPESDIYKEISSIAGETTESDSSVNTVRKIIEDGRDSITSFVNEDITELGDYAFKDCVNLEYVYLPNCTKLGNECFQNCTSLKTLLLPNVTEIANSSHYLDGLSNLEVIDLSSYDSDNYIEDAYYGWYYYRIGIIFEQSKFPKLRILSYGIDGLGDGGEYFGWNDLEILILPNLKHLGIASSCRANNIILPSSQVVFNSGGGYLSGTMYVNDDILSDYQNDERWNHKYDRGEILPISQLPQEIREELELCQIQI